MAIRKIGPALAAGNAVVLKPAPATPRASLALSRLAPEAGLPPGVLNLVTGGGDVGQALVDGPGTDMVSITGSSATGRSVMTAAARNAKRVHLDLAGKASALVFADADIASMARAVTLGATYNCGQDCTAATRVYVQRAAYGDAVDALVATAASVRVGDPRDSATDIGPLISRDHRDLVHGSSAARSCRERSSGRCSSCCRSTTRTTRYASQTTAPTASPRRCGPATWAAH